MLPIKRLKQTEGKLLTLIDAILPEGNQSKATKDIVKQITGELYSYADYSESFEYTINDGTGTNLTINNSVDRKDKK